VASRARAPAGDDGSLPNNVADQLRTMIVRGRLLPGEHLGQSQLADMFGRSKVPIREALKLLATEGFLRHDRNRGYFVPPLEVDEARQLYKLRRWIEHELLATALWPDDQQLADLRGRFEQLDAMDQMRDFATWAEALEKLRYALFDLSPQKLLLHEATRLWRLTDRYRALLPRSMAESPERTLIDALEARDRETLLSSYRAARTAIEAMLEQAMR
jgi:DNA-binding GntR family transcriptional regulator